MRYLFELERESPEKAEKAIRVLENNLIKTLDAFHFGIILFDETGNCMGLNRRWQDIFLLNYEQMQDYNMLQDTNLQGKHIWEPIKKSFEGVPGVVSDNFFTPEEWEKPGRGRWTRGYALPLFHNDRADEKQVGEALILQDVTDEIVTRDEVRRLSSMIEELQSQQHELAQRLLTIHETERHLLDARPHAMPSLQDLKKYAPKIPRREREVFERLAAGCTVKETAHQLGLGAKSVYTYRTRLLTRLKLTSDVELALAWREIYNTPLIDVSKT